MPFAELVDALEKALAAAQIDRYTIETFRPFDTGPATVGRLRAILTATEASADDLLLAYVNQGDLTGAWDRPPSSPLGACDAGTGRMLVMDVDRA